MPLITYVCTRIVIVVMFVVVVSIYIVYQYKRRMYLHLYCDGRNNRDIFKIQYYLAFDNKTKFSN